MSDDLHRVLHIVFIRASFIPEDVDFGPEEREMRKVSWSVASYLTVTACRVGDILVGVETFSTGPC